MTAYYNEIDPFAAAWLKELVKQGHIAYGVVDTRSIDDVRPADLTGFTQCHFFAGIGAWSYALRQAGWPDDRPVWTGSCPCQPFSSAGRLAGFNDERHLWPSWHWLITQCRPSSVFGEQVAAKSVDPWIDLVQSDLEALDYAVGGTAFPAASVGAPIVRDRFYWVALAGGDGGPQRREDSSSGSKRIEAEKLGSVPLGSSPRGDTPSVAVDGFWAGCDWLACRDGRFRPVEPGAFPLAHGATGRVGRLRGYGNAINVQAAKTFIKAVTQLS